MHPVERALSALRRGEPVLLYDADGREGETDIVYASEHVTPEAIRRLRTDGGGLVCTAVAPEHHAKLGLPFLADLLREASPRHPVLRGLGAHDVKYDASKSSFGLTINSRATFTGIPDEDRSRTIQDLAAFLGGIDGLAAAEATAAFGRRFRAPGHTILLNGSPGGLAQRQGHTELSLALVRMAGLVPSTTICEMLDPVSGRARSKIDAQAYGDATGLVFLTGHDVIQAWQTRAPTPAPSLGPMSAS